MVNHADYAFDKLKFYRIDGQKVSKNDARDHFASKQRIVVIQNGGEINDYFELVFHDDVMIVEVPEHQEQAHAAPLRRPAARTRRVRSSEKKGDK